MRGVRLAAAVCLAVAVAFHQPAAACGESPGSHRVVSIALPGGVSLEMVEATNGFFIGKYEVTQEQWLALMTKENFFFHGESGLPADHVTWRLCHEFIGHVNDLESTRSAGLRVRLPTEEEWVLCLLAGQSQTEAVPSDGESLGGRAWFWGNAKRYLHPVGGKRPNAWGLYDMQGNVWELCDTVLFGACVSKGGDIGSPVRECDPSYRNLSGKGFTDYCGVIGVRLAADSVVADGVSK